MKSVLEQVVALRREERFDEALALLDTALESARADATLHYQYAWTCDAAGYETRAAPHYEAALAAGLAGDDRMSAFTGLGSTYRCIGDYEAAERTLMRAIQEFPEHTVLRVFLAMTKYNLGRQDAAATDLLTLLLDTTSDPTIRAYERALRFYADKLDETWK